MKPPADFTPHFRKSPLTDPWEPLFSRVTDDGVSLGLTLAGAHTNSRGFAHGGLISALADNAMGLSCARRVGGGLVTVNLSLDFVGTGRIGQWLQIVPQVIRTGATLCFAQALVTADGEVCARANATFRVAKAA